MSKTILKYGLIGGAIITVLMMVSLFLMMNFISYDFGKVVGYLTMLLGFSTIYLAIKHIRDNQLGGSIRFGKAFGIGILVTLTVTVIYVSTWMIYVSINGDAFLDTFFQRALDDIQNSGKTAEEINLEIAAMKESMELYKNPLVQLVFTFLEIFPVGLLVTIISATILRKK